MRYKLRTTKQYDKQLKKCLKRGYDEAILKEVVTCLVEGNALPIKHRAHRLSAKFDYCWECHITPDWLLLWECNEEELILLLLQTGTHSDIF